MKTCHVCGQVCEDFEEYCSKCGAYLNREEEQEEQKEPEIIIENPTLLATFDDIVSAEIFKDILTENGIRYSGDDPDGEIPLRVSFGVGIFAEDIYVGKADIERATALYNDFLENPPFSEIIVDDGDSE